MDKYTIVVPAKAGTHTHSTGFESRCQPQQKATPTVLTNNRHGVWVPAFAGTTSKSYDESREP